MRTTILQRQLDVAKHVEAQFKDIDEKMVYMTREFDAFRMRITSQYIELTKKTLAKLQ